MDLMMAGDNSGRTPLHLAVRRGHTHLVQEMLVYAEGVDGSSDESADLVYDLLHAETTKGYTALHLAAEQKDIETAKLLLDWGTNPTKKCQGGCIHYAHLWSVCCS
jgi:ankyrin repeat protein